MASKEAASLNATVHAKQDELAPNSVIVSAERTKPLIEEAVRAPGVRDEQFPTADLSAADPRDAVMKAKLDLQEPGQMGVTPFGKLVAKDSDFEWLQKKQAAAEAANFQKWFADEFDHMSPAEKKRAKELYPEFYAQRKKLLKKQTKNLFELARLKLEGIQNRDDLITQYLAETGRLDIGPLNNLLNPELSVNTDATYQKRFQRGLLSPFRFFGNEVITKDRDVGLQGRGDSEIAFAQRKDSSLRSGVQLGIYNNVGFPPFGTGLADQGDKQWWEKLQQ